METNNVPGFLSPTVEDLMIYDRIFKRSLKCKCFALIFCITGTVILLLLPLNFLDSKLLAIVMPSFLTGYIFVNFAGILTACRGHVNLLADISFSTCGASVNMCCGIYLLYYWIDWVIGTLESGNGIEGTLYLVLSISCFLNVISMGGELLLSLEEIKRRVVPDARDGEQ